MSGDSRSYICCSVGETVDLLFSTCNRCNPIVAIETTARQWKLKHACNSIRSAKEE
jgi:hypothetical protein